MFKPHLRHTYGIGLGPKPCGDSPFCSEAQKSEEEEVLFMSPLKKEMPKIKNKLTKLQSLEPHFSLQARCLKSNWAEEIYWANCFLGGKWDFVYIYIKIYTHTHTHIILACVLFKILNAIMNWNPWLTSLFLLPFSLERHAYFWCCSVQ